MTSALGPPRPPFIDCHAHLFERTLPTVGSSRHKLDYDFTGEDYLKLLDAHGVHFGVLSAASNYGDYNDFLLASLAGRPRLRATVIVSPAVELTVLRQMQQRGAVGIRLMFRGVPDAMLPDLTSFDYRRLFRRVRDLDWHVHLHCEGTRSAPFIEALERAEVKLVIDHFGTPDPAKGIRCAGFRKILQSIQNGRTWVKLSSGFRMDKALAQELAAELIRSAGPERLVWGSDCPFGGFEGESELRRRRARFLRLGARPRNASHHRLRDTAETVFQLNGRGLFARLRMCHNGSQ